MNEIARKSVRTILEATKRLVNLTRNLESEPIENCIDEITDEIWVIFGWPLSQNEDNTKFINAMVAFQHGRIEMDECLRIMDEYANARR